MGFLGKIIQIFKDWFYKLIDWYQKQTAEEKRRLAIICTCAFSLLLTISVLISFAGRERETRTASEMLPVNVNRQILPISSGDLFLPEEPDFLPGVILEKERKTSWTEKDAAEHWQDPLRGGEEPWRVKIETAIDDFLERIP